MERNGHHISTLESPTPIQIYLMAGACSQLVRNENKATSIEKRHRESETSFEIRPGGLRTRSALDSTQMGEQYSVAGGISSVYN